MKVCNQLLNIIKWPFKILAAVFYIVVMIIGFLSIIPLITLAHAKDCDEVREGFKFWYEMIAADIEKLFEGKSSP